MSTTENSTRVKAPTITRPEVIGHPNTVREDEDTLLNPPGRSESDGVENNKVNTNKPHTEKLINCRKEILISSMNLRTIRADHKRKELAFQFNNKGLSVLGVQDHKIVHDEDDDEVKTEVIDGCTLITTTAWRNTRNAAVGGVGIMLNSQTTKAVADIEAYNNGILRSFQRKPSDIHNCSVRTHRGK